MSLIPRHLTAAIAGERPPKAVAIFGPRRVGKTTMLEMLVGTAKARWYIGDSPAVQKQLQLQTPGDIRNALLQDPVIVIDEAHKIENIGNLVKMLVDANGHLDKPSRIYLTSSSPFYCEGLLLRDLLDSNPVRRPDKFRMLVQLLAYYVGSEVSYDSLGRECGLNRLTVEDYISKLEQASIIKVCSSLSGNLSNELRKGKKIYFFDNGIRNALVHDFSPMAVRRDAGALWENFFFMERVKLHDTLRDFTRIYFWRTTENVSAEVDFVEVKDQSIQAFECKLSDKVKKSRGHAKFLQAYPGSTVQIVHPVDCRNLFENVAP